jgi:hypothetical protein
MRLVFWYTAKWWRNNLKFVCDSFHLGYDTTANDDHV